MYELVNYRFFKEKGDVRVYELSVLVMLIYTSTTSHEKHWSANLAHACIRCQIASLWYICMLVALNATKYVIMTDLTARLNLEESNQYSVRSISAGDAIMT